MHTRLQCNSVQNKYFGFFIFEKQTDLCCFATYLSNNPRIIKLPVQQKAITKNYLEVKK